MDEIQLKKRSLIKETMSNSSGTSKKKCIKRKRKDQKVIANISFECMCVQMYD